MYSLIFFINICCIFLGVRLDGFKANIINIQPKIPTRYVIPQKRSIIPKNQYSRGSCWIFATIGMVESSYRGYGVDHGLLNETEYVQFSEQAFGKLIYEYCQEHKEIPICDYGGLGINATSDGSVEFIYYLDDYAKETILPTSVCPYHTTRGEGEFHCNDDNLAKIMEESPIDFKITDIKTMYSVEEIKQTMVEKESTISYGLATILKGYYFECNEQNPAVNDAVCTECHIPCYQAASGQFIKDEIDKHVEVCIITDGWDNASVYQGVSECAQLLNEKQEKGWQIQIVTPENEPVLVEGIG